MSSWIRVFTDGLQQSAALQLVVYYMTSQDFGGEGRGERKKKEKEKRLNGLVNLFINAIIYHLQVILFTCWLSIQNQDTKTDCCLWKGSLIYSLFYCHFVPPGQHFTVYQIKIMHFDALLFIFWCSYGNACSVFTGISVGVGHIAINHVL